MLDLKYVDYWKNMSPYIKGTNYGDVSDISLFGLNAIQEAAGDFLEIITKFDIFSAYRIQQSNQIYLHLKMEKIGSHSKYIYT